MACVPLESPSAYNMYLFNLQIVNHVLIKILKKIKNITMGNDDAGDIHYDITLSNEDAMCTSQCIMTLL